MNSLNPAGIRAAQAAYMAKDCVDRIHDVTSLETAGRALNHYSTVLVTTSPEDQELVKAIHEDVPSMKELLEAFRQAGAGLCRNLFAPDMAQVS